MGTYRASGRWIFDLAVLVAVGSAVWLALEGRWDGTFRFAMITCFMLAARGADVPPPFAAAFALFLLLATWSSVQHWYRQIDQFDVVVHVLTPGSLAAVAYFVLVRARLLPPARGAAPALRPWAPTVWVVVVGTTAAVVWEFYERVMEHLSPASMRVGYTDTVIDLAAGMTGSLVAGALVAAWGRRQQRS